MKKLFGIIALSAVSAFMAGDAAARSPRETAVAVFTVEPAMSTSTCENKIKTGLRFEKGVTAVATSLQTGMVTVTYDPARTDVAGLTTALAGIGYTAAEVKEQVADNENDNNKQ